MERRPDYFERGSEHFEVTKIIGWSFGESREDDMVKIQWAPETMDWEEFDDMMHCDKIDGVKMREAVKTFTLEMSEVTGVDDRMRVIWKDSWVMLDGLNCDELQDEFVDAYQEDLSKIRLVRNGYSARVVGARTWDVWRGMDGGLQVELVDTDVSIKTE